jgi:hypothetical protein
MKTIRHPYAMAVVEYALLVGLAVGVTTAVMMITHRSAPVTLMARR